MTTGLSRMVADLERESAGLKMALEELNTPSLVQEAQANFTRFLP